MHPTIESCAPLQGGFSLPTVLLGGKPQFLTQSWLSHLQESLHPLCFSEGVTSLSLSCHWAALWDLARCVSFVAAEDLEEGGLTRSWVAKREKAVLQASLASLWQGVTLTATAWTSGLSSLGVTGVWE